MKAVVSTGSEIKTTAYIGDYFEVLVGDPKPVTAPTPVECSMTICLYLPLVIASAPQIPAGHAWTIYYYAGGSRVAMRVKSNQDGIEDGLIYLLTDHLGSTAITLDPSGNLVSELRYSAWGETRYTSGATPTQRRYTGQLEAEAGLYFYNARWFDPLQGRFAQADTVIPDISNPLDLDRYAYSRNNPVNYNDPSGHSIACHSDAGNGCDGFGPYTIINQGVDIGTMYDELHTFFKLAPNYKIENDPLVFGQNIEPIVRTSQFQVEVEKPTYWGVFTVQVEVGGSAFFGVGIRGDISLAVDGRGNSGIMVGFGGGGYTAVGFNRVGPFITITDAPSITHLEGNSVQVGGQIGGLISIGIEGIFFKGKDGNLYKGLNLAGGASFMGPWPGEFHGTVENTSTLLRLNEWK